MLTDYIDRYKEALKQGDHKTAMEIERALAMLGMDRATLMVIEKKWRYQNERSIERECTGKH